MRGAQVETSRARVFLALHDIAVALGGVLEPGELARLVVDHARDLLDAGAVGLYVFDTQSQMLRPLHSSDAREGVPEPTITPGSGAAGMAFMLGQPVLVDDYPSWPNAGSWAAANGVISAMAVPLQVADQRTGAMSVRTYAPRHWTDDDAQTMTLLAAQVAPALEAARLYERTRTAQLQAEAAIKLRDDVLAGVSHDLAGPLARVRLYAELIQAEATTISSEELAQQLGSWGERIVAATASMKAVIQDILDVAKLQMGQELQLECRRIDLVGLVRRCIGEHHSSGRTVRLEASREHLYGVWDEARLNRVLGNLLDNALKYSERDQEVVVRVDFDGDGDAVGVLSVQDHGVGIPAEDLPHVFERFYRGRNAIEQAGGTGLGLTMVLQIVEQHGGTVSIDSRAGGGTLVSLRLPREVAV
jgi:signal transduction histidine kinase